MTAIFYSHFFFLLLLSYPFCSALIKFVSALLLHPLSQPLYFCCETCLPAPLAFTGTVTFMSFWTADYTSWVLPSRHIYTFSYCGEKKHGRRSSLGLSIDCLGVEVWPPRFPAAGSWTCPHLQLCEPLGPGSLQSFLSLCRHWLLQMIYKNGQVECSCASTQREQL